MDLASAAQITALLKQNGFSFKKSLGQNFLTDPAVCPKMANAAADADCGVIEIGPGAGVLTRELSQVAKRVVAIELDRRLEPVLSQTLSGCDNVKIIFEDALKCDLEKIIKQEFADCKRVNVCANLPYYITSPLIMRLLESRLSIESVVVMVQKEAAERLCAAVGTRAAGAVTVAVSYFAEAKLLFDVGRGCFTPAPNVDSAVIELKLLKTPPVEVADEKAFFALSKACFAQRRKTLVNTVSSTLGIDKAVIKAALSKMGLDESVRGEALTLSQLAELSRLLG